MVKNSKSTRHIQKVHVFNISHPLNRKSDIEAGMRKTTARYLSQGFSSQMDSAAGRTAAEVVANAV